MLSYMLLPNLSHLGLNLDPNPPRLSPLSWAPSLGLQGTWQMISVDIWPHAVPAPSSFWARASRCLGEQMAILRDKWWKQQKLRYQEICDMNHEWNMYIYIFNYKILYIYIYVYIHCTYTHIWILSTVVYMILLVHICVSKCANLSCSWRPTMTLIQWFLGPMWVLTIVSLSSFSAGYQMYMECLLCIYLRIGLSVTPFIWW